MNKNEIFTKLPPEIGDAYHEFHARYFLYRSLWVAGGCALGVLAVKGYQRIRERQAEQQLVQEVTGALADTSGPHDAA